jgi:homoserine kinase
VSSQSVIGTASAPATSANLGPAFDCLALALDIRCRVTASPAEEWAVKHIGAYQPESGAVDCVLTAAKRTVGEETPLGIEVESSVPIGKGLGSSAAAFVAGCAAALLAVGDEARPDQVFRMASDMEGHSDNVAAAVYGGLVLVPAEGMPIRLPLHPGLRVVIALPEGMLPTYQARTVIDSSHPHDMVRRSLARVSALTAGLITGDAETLAAAHGDEIHEAPRARISPEVEDLIESAKKAGAMHAARSGAGPSVVALCSGDQEARVAAALEVGGLEVLRPSIASTGLITA